MSKEEMLVELNKIETGLDASKPDNVIRSIVISQVKELVINYDTLDDKNKAFVDGFFKDYPQNT